MPSAPEFSDRGAEVWHVEVLHQLETHDLGAAERDIGVAGEVAVDLDCEEECGDDVRDAGPTCGAIVDGVDKWREAVRDGDFLEQAPAHEQQSLTDVGRVIAMPLVELVQDVLRPLDGPCDQLRIEHHVERKDAEVAFRGLVPAVDFDGVAQGLKGMEGESDGQQHTEVGYRPVDAERDGEIVGGMVEEIVVLENRQNPDVGDDTGDEPEAPGLSF